MGIDPSDRAILNFVGDVFLGTNPRDYVIRGHLFLEAELTRLIELAVPRPEALQLDRDYDFPHKLSLAVALGCVAENEVGPLRRLNRYRNDFAHQLDRIITPKDGADLRNSLGPRGREMLSDLMAGEPRGRDPMPYPADDLRRTILVMYVMLRVDRRTAEETPPEQQWALRKLLAIGGAAKTKNG